jgi:predicted PurR-regulated permease PerM
LTWINDKKDYVMTAQQAFRNTLIVLGTVAGAYVLLLSVRIVIVLLVAIIIASAALPAVQWLQRRLKMSQGLAILLVYLGIIVTVLVVMLLIVPPAVNNLAGYITNEDRLANRIVIAQDWLERNIENVTNSDIELLPPENIRTSVNQITAQLSESFPTLASEIGGLLGDLILAVVMGIYWLTSRAQAVAFIQSLFPLGRRSDVVEMFDEIEHSLGAYVRGVALVVAFVSVANGILLFLFGVPNPVMLALIIGLTTALPIIGGFIGAGVASLLALLSSPLHAVLTLLSFVLVQQVETHYLTPRTMARSVNINPILVIVVIFIGFGLGGVVGGLIAVPLAGTAMILLRHLVIEPMREEAAPTVVHGGGVLLTGTETLDELAENRIQTP